MLKNNTILTFAAAALYGTLCAGQRHLTAIADGAKPGGGHKKDIALFSVDWPLPLAHGDAMMARIFFFIAHGPLRA
ncbi:hypothetical protein [Cronobacter dublinensis]|uniref:hypothetical protein n=1 Tax=Cronobacter dublinensis TaxID=413497 RepID=UPI0010721107|nr:hypothetical protein [Cronobacter dublinensis]